jgi:hypothetical protein
MSDITSSNWNKQIEGVLNDIRLNCNTLEEFHKDQYFAVKKIVVWFKLPIIILSSLNAIVAVSLQSYLDQSYISATNCGLSFIIGTLTSISLYLKIEDRLETELLASKEYHKLSIDIYKVLSLKNEDRQCDGDKFLNDIYNSYVKLFDRSNLLDIEFKDKLKIEFFNNIEPDSINYS